MRRLSKSQLWFLGIGSVFLVAGISLGVVFRGKLRSESVGNENDDDFDYEDEEDEGPLNLLEELSCLDIGRTFRGFWDCLVEGLPRSPKEPPSRVPAVLRLRRVNVSANGSSKRKRRVKRHEPHSNASHYAPLDPEMVFTLTPVSHKAWWEEEYRQEYNDYTKSFPGATSEYLYEYNPDSSRQFNPPWSYHGSMSPKEWYKLEIEKFFPPLADNLTPRQAIFRDFFIEKGFFDFSKYDECYEESNLLKDAKSKDSVPESCHQVGVFNLADFANRELAIKYHKFINKIGVLYFSDETTFELLFPANPGNKEAQLAMDQIPNAYYAHAVSGGFSEVDVIFDNRLLDSIGIHLEDYAKQKDYTLRFEINNEKREKEKNGLNGFYSSMRFILPPDITDAELTALRLEEKVGLPKNFVRANRNALPLNQYLFYLRQNVYNDLTNKTIDVEEKDLLIDAFREQFNSYFPDNKLADEEMLRTGYSFIEKDIKDTEKELKERVRYSLQLFPLQFRICSHREQSPININTSLAIHGAIGPYTLGDNACRRYPMRVSFPSDGTNVLSLKLEGSSRLLGTAVTLQDGAVRGEMLYFDEMHVHIGRDETSGSEHRLNGKGYAMELQLIFSLHGANPRTPYFFTLARQMNDLFPVREQLVLIMAVFVEVVAKPENKFLFEPLVQAASQFRKVSEAETLKEKELRGRQPRGYYVMDPVMSIREFIPDSVYYTYRGSLTIPPCFPYVIWSVFEKPLQISKEQYQELRLWPTPSADDHDFLAGNVRDLADIYSEDENDPGISQEMRDAYKNLRNNRIVIKSNPSGWNPDYYSSHSDSLKAFVSPMLCLLAICILSSYSQIVNLKILKSMVGVN